MHQVKVKLREFSAAHRLLKNYSGKCRNIHGHNYLTYLTLSTEQLDDNDFVADFSLIKKHCQTWVNDHWDHCVILSELDPVLLDFVRAQQQKYYLIPGEQNTTVEILSQHLFDKLSEQVRQFVDVSQTKIRLTEVELWETSTSSAVYTQRVYDYTLNTACHDAKQR